MNPVSTDDANQRREYAWLIDDFVHNIMPTADEFGTAWDTALPSGTEPAEQNPAAKGTVITPLFG